MSDWGATPDWEFAMMGLDQESGLQIDVLMWKSEAFTTPLRAAYAAGKLPKERLSEMVRRILRSMYAIGVDRWGPLPKSIWRSTTRSRSKQRDRELSS